MKVVPCLYKLGSKVVAMKGDLRIAGEILHTKIKDGKRLYNIAGIDSPSGWVLESQIVAKVNRDGTP